MKLIAPIPFLILSIILPLVVGCKTLKQRKYTKSLKDYSFTWDGYKREYLVYFPSAMKSHRPLPVLFHLHGGGGSAEGTPGLTFGRFNELADREGFIVVYPDAIDKNWNDGRGLQQVFSQKEDIDDVGFIVEIINRLKKEFKIDGSRIFTAGMSNGGFMSTRLLCDRADLFKGGAIVTATISEAYLPYCSPSRPVGVLVMNGTDDNLVPYDGGHVQVLGRKRGKIISTDQYVQFWKDKNQCSDVGRKSEMPDMKNDGTTVSKHEFKSCARGGNVTLYTIQGGGHTWPGGLQYLGEGLIGKTSKDINACDVIWEYFQTL